MREAGDTDTVKGRRKKQKKKEKREIRCMQQVSACALLQSLSLSLRLNCVSKFEKPKLQLVTMEHQKAIVNTVIFGIFYTWWISLPVSPIMQKIKA